MPKLNLVPLKLHSMFCAWKSVKGLACVRLTIAGETLLFHGFIEVGIIGLSVTLAQRDAERCPLLNLN